MPTQDTRKQVALALEAVNNKKAEDVALLQLPGESSTFTDYFLICSGSNPRQVQAIADEVDERLSKDMGVEPNAREGYETAEWILLDYVDFVVHIFNAQRRAYYDLERLWKSAHKLTAEELLNPRAEAEVEATPEAPAPAVKKRAKKAAAKKSIGVRAAAKQSARGAKAPARKVAAKKTARKTAVKKVAAKKTATKKVAVKKVAAKKTATKKVAVKKVSAKKTAAKKVAVKKSAAKKASSKKK
jgi:ribosome-associated protein